MNDWRVDVPQRTHAILGIRSTEGRERTTVETNTDLNNLGITSSAVINLPFP
jgi:hypothetical protein